MATFSQRITSNDRIQIDPQTVEAILADPDLVAELTPLVASIETDGDRWRWQLVGVNALGISFAPAFTTLMDIKPGRIAFEPDPAADDRATADGVISVEADGKDHTVVAIDLTACVVLPLPKVATGAVRRVMFQTMKAGGGRFAENLLRHIGNPAHRGLDVGAGEG